MIKKNIKQIVLILLLSFFCLLNIKVYAKNASFSVLSNDVSVTGFPVKLMDGRLLIYSSEGNTIFDPKTNKFKKTESFLYDSTTLTRYNPIVLKDGRVLFLSPETSYPSEYSEIQMKIQDIVVEYLLQKRLRESINGKSLSEKEYSTFRRECRKEYTRMSENDRAKIYLPLIKRCPELYEEYKRYVEEYELSMYGQIYDPKTETFQYTKGKLKTRRRLFNLFLLEDGKVLIVGGQSILEPNEPRTNFEVMGIRARQMEIYDPDTDKFSMLPTFLPESVKHSSLLQLKNGEIYDPFLGYKYNPKTNIFTTVRKTLGSGHIMLQNGQIAYIPQTGRNNMKINIYNPDTDTISTQGEILIPRGGSFGMALLKDGNILVYGGINEARSGPFMGTVYENRLEIFNPKTGKSQLLNKRHSTYLYSATLLDDGRLFFISANGYELFEIK